MGLGQEWFPKRCIASLVFLATDTFILIKINYFSPAKFWFSVLVFVSFNSMPINLIVFFSNNALPCTLNNVCLKICRLRFLINNNKRLNSYTVCTYNWVIQRGFRLYSVEIIYIFPDSSKLTIHILKTKINGVVESFHIGS